MFKTRILAWAVGVVFVFIFFDKFNYWYIWIPLSFLLIFIPYIYFILTKAIIADFQFLGSTKGDDNKYTTFFNVSFQQGINGKTELKGLLHTNYRLEEGDVLFIISSTRKTKIRKGVKRLKEGSTLTSMIFYHNYKYRGEILKVSFMLV